MSTVVRGPKIRFSLIRIEHITYGISVDGTDAVGAGKDITIYFLGLRIYFGRHHSYRQ